MIGVEKYNEKHYSKRIVTCDAPLNRTPAWWGTERCLGRALFSPLPLLQRENSLLILSPLQSQHGDYCSHLVSFQATHYFSTGLSELCGLDLLKGEAPQSPIHGCEPAPPSLRQAELPWRMRWVCVFTTSAPVGEGRNYTAKASSMLSMQLSCQGA